MMSQSDNDLRGKLRDLSPEKRELLELLLKSELEDKGKKVTPVRRDTNEFPLSFSQHRIWFLEQLEPNSPIYNLPLAIKLIGEINLHTFQLVIDQIVTRHESLRTVFSEIDGNPIQIVKTTMPVHVEIFDYSDKPQNEIEPIVLEHAGSIVLEPFDIKIGPLFRICVFRITPVENLILLNMHHIVSDGWSMGVLIEEIITRYEMIIQGVEFHPPDMEVQYPDYAVWQQNYYKKGDRLEKQFDYWKKKLENSENFLNLPTDFPRPVVREFKGDHIQFVIPSEDFAGLLEFSKEKGVTIFTSLLTVFKILLYRYSGQSDISIGTPHANRNRKEIENIIGFFVNTLVLRSDLSGNPLFEDLLKMVHETNLGAFENSDFPFETLVERLDPERDMSSTPLFQIMFILQNAPWKRKDIPGLTMEMVDLHSGTSKFDLTLVISESKDQLLCSLEFSTEIFTTTTIKKLASHFQYLLRSISKEPHQYIDSIQYLSEEEEKELVYVWNKLEYGIPEGRSLASLFEEQVEKTPDRVAVVADGRNGREQLTYEDLNRKANQLARRMKRMGVERGELVGLFVERSVEMMVGLMGVLKAGAAYVPMDPLYPVERLGYIIEDVSKSMEKPPVVVVQSWLEEKLPEGIGEVVRVDADWDEIGLESGDNLGVEIESTDLAYVLYTSGSTGKPKGVMIEQRSVVNIWMALRKEIYGKEEGEGLRVAQNAPLLFDVSVGQWVMMMSGETVYLVPQEIRMSGEKLVEWIEENRIEVIDCVPTQLKIMLRAGLTRGGEHWRPRDVLPCGEAIDDATWDELAASEGIRFTNLYGPTECTVYSTYCHVEQFPEKPLIGRGVANSPVYVLDGNRELVPVGVPGELYISGKGVGRGYLNKPEMTAERFMDDPYRSGSQDVQNW